MAACDTAALKRSSMSRTELHIHLDGSIPPAELLQISIDRELVLPGIDRVPATVDDIWAALRSQGEIWKWFGCRADRTCRRASTKFGDVRRPRRAGSTS